MLHSVRHVASRLFLVVAAFVTLAVVIMTQPPKGLRDYDQSFYLTIAYDVDRYGVFSNGIFDENRYSIFSNGILDKTDRISEVPAPGMFFVPGFPLLVLAAMKLDDRFAKAVECSVEANYKKRNGAECEVYATPMHTVHAFLLAACGACSRDAWFARFCGGSRHPLQSHPNRSIFGRCSLDYFDIAVEELLAIANFRAGTVTPLQLHKRESPPVAPRS